MMFVKSVQSFLSKWHDDESGNVAVESVFMVPLLFWAYLGTHSYFDVYKHEGISFKANITIADMVSRETNYINDAYIDGAQGLLEFLSNVDESPELRITAFRWIEADNKYEVVWSKERGDKPELTTATLANHEDKLPIMVDYEVAILVETWMDYERPFDIPLADGLYVENYTVNAFTVTSPRFATQICFGSESSSVC